MTHHVVCYLLLLLFRNIHTKHVYGIQSRAQDKTPTSDDDYDQEGPATVERRAAGTGGGRRRMSQRIETTVSIKSCRIILRRSLNGASLPIT